MERARRGRYQRSSLKDFPAEWITHAFSQGDDDFSVKARFREGIDFLVQDIRRQQPDGPFDLILCRHLAFTYFDEQAQVGILRQLTDRLHRGGALVIGKQEAFPSAADGDLQVVEEHSGIYW